MGGFTGGGGADASGNADKQNRRELSSITKREAARFRESKRRTKKAVSKSKLDTYELPKSDAPGAAGVVLDATRDLRQKSFEANRKFFQENVLTSKNRGGYEDTFDSFEQYMKDRSSGSIDAYGNRNFATGEGGGGGNEPSGIEMAKSASTQNVTKDAQKTAVENAPDGPTSTEMASTETDDERIIKNKRKGRRNTILNKPQGLDEDVELGKKYLLG